MMMLLSMTSLYRDWTVESGIVTSEAHHLDHQIRSY